MAVGFRNNPVPRNNTIDWSYLDVPIPDYKSVSEVGNTNTSGMIHQGGNSDSSGNAGSPGVNRYSGIPRLTFANPDKQDVFRQLRENSRDVSRLSTPQIPANLDFGNTIYDVDSGNFVPHEYPKIPSILGTEAVNNTLLYGRPSGAGHLSTNQVNNIHNAAAKSQAYNRAAWDALSNSGGAAATQHYTHTDPQGNWSIIDPVQELASINETGWDMKGNYMPDMSNAYWEHKAAQDAIANYGAHESTNSGGIPGGGIPGGGNSAWSPLNDPYSEAERGGNFWYNPPASLENEDDPFPGIPNLSGHDVTNIGQGFDYGGNNSPGHPANLSTNDPGSGGKG
jgi:hypothetical protein